MLCTTEFETYRNPFINGSKSQKADLNRGFETQFTYLFKGDTKGKLLGEWYKNEDLAYNFTMYQDGIIIHFKGKEEVGNYDASLVLYDRDDPFRRVLIHVQVTVKIFRIKLMNSLKRETRFVLPDRSSTFELNATGSANDALDMTLLRNDNNMFQLQILQNSAGSIDGELKFTGGHVLGSQYVAEVRVSASDRSTFIVYTANVEIGSMPKAPTQTKTAEIGGM